MTAEIVLARDPAVGSPAAAGSEGANVKGQTQDEQQLNIDYAEVYLKIAEIDLQKALESNRRIARTIPEAQIDHLKQVVRLAEEQLKQAKGESNNNLALKGDEGQVKSAEEVLQTAVAANNRAPGSVPQVELDRLRLLAQLSRLQLAKNQVASRRKVDLEEMHQRIEGLETDVRALNEQLARLLATHDGDVTAKSTSRSSRTGK